MSGAFTVGIVRGTAIALLVVLPSCAGEGSAPVARPIEIRGFAFVPATVEPRAGDTLVWTNRDIVPHTVTEADTAWDSDTLEPGRQWRHVVAAFDTAYFCRYHPTMRGAIRVTGR